MIASKSYRSSSVMDNRTNTILGAYDHEVDESKSAECGLRTRRQREEGSSRAANGSLQLGQNIMFVFLIDSRISVE